MFTRKSVCIVGNAKSLFGKNLGEKIDAYDVVIRLNRGLIVDPVQQGSRTTAIGVSCLLTDEELASYGTCPVIWLTPDHRDNIPDDYVRYPIDMWERLSKDHLGGGRPSSGAMILDFVKSMKPSSVTLVGFDFKKTKTFYHEGRDHRGPHNWRLEKKYCHANAEIM